MFFYTNICLQAIYATTTRKNPFIRDDDEKTTKREQDTTQGLETHRAPDSCKFLYIYFMFNYTNILITGYIRDYDKKTTKHEQDTTQGLETRRAQI
jgi:hypothetical protein